MDALHWVDDLWDSTWTPLVKDCLLKFKIMTKNVFLKGLGDGWKVLEEILVDVDPPLLLAIKKAWFRGNGLVIPSLKRRIPEAHLRPEFKKMKKDAISGSNTFTSAIRGCNGEPQVLATKIKDLGKFVGDFNGSKKDLVSAISSNMNLVSAAKVILGIDQCAANSVRSNGSEVALYGTVCANAGFEAFPVSVDSLTSFAAVLKIADYRGANAYVSAVMTCNKLLGFIPSPELVSERASISKSVQRGKGDGFHVSPIGPKILKQVAGVSHLMGANFYFFSLVFDLSVIAMFFMMRSDEVLSIRRRHISFIGDSEVAILICKDKTNSKEVEMRLPFSECLDIFGLPKMRCLPTFGIP